MNAVQSLLLADTWMHGGWGWGWMTMMMVPMMLLWGAIIFGAAWLIRGASRSDLAAEKEPAKESPVEILERRFAEGAITVEDYRTRRQVLANGAPESNGTPEEERLTAHQAGEGRRS